ncbi:transporter [Candidatus Woesearchaeota archaeon]|nr:transporter [Candidatus Woesearchaeota archaeon]
MNYIKKTIATLALIVATALPAYASDIFIGKRGPTSWQVDQRLSLAENELHLETITSNTIFKYWTGKEKGGWFFVNLPYKHLSLKDEENSGLGDLIIGGGPRGTFSFGKAGQLDVLSYGSLTLPTGETAAKLPLGNGRYDLTAGIFASYVHPEFDVHASASYTATGENKKGINPPDKTDLGMVIGREVVKNFRLAAGMTTQQLDDGRHLESARIVGRYTFSPNLHIELIGDYGTGHNSMPLQNSAMFILRYNL